MTLSGPMTSKPGGGALKEWTIAVSVVYSLILAAGGGYVFYASIRPVSIPTGYFSEFADGPWEVASVVLLAVWVLGPVMLLALGIDLYLYNRLTTWFAVG